MKTDFQLFARLGLRECLAWAVLTSVLGLTTTTAHGQTEGVVRGVGSTVYCGPCVPGAASPSVSVSAGWYHGISLKPDGTVRCWGDNRDQQTAVPANVTGVMAISGGGRHSLALLSNGVVRAWGANDYRQLSIPSFPSPAAAVAAGADHNLALLRNGTVRAWGRNNSGETNVPAGATSVRGIAAGSGHSVAVRSNGTVIAWGQTYNGSGFVPVQPPAGLTDVVAVAAGIYHQVALRSNGTVVAWGFNGNGQTNVPRSATNVVKVKANGYHTIAIRANGSAVAWGSEDPSALPLPIYFNEGAIDAAAGVNFSLAIIVQGPSLSAVDLAKVVRPGGSVLLDGAPFVSGSPPLAYSWNWNGQSVPGVSSNRLELNPTLLEQAGLYELIASNRVGTATGQFVVTVQGPVDAGALVAWGANDRNQSLPPSVVTNVVSVSLGNQHGAALRLDGTVSVWGASSAGVGNVPPAAREGVVAIASGRDHVLALRREGGVVAWGANDHGQATVPTSAQSGVTAIAAGAWHSLALKTNGAVVAWGSDAAGQIAVPLAAQAGVVAIAAGTSHSLAVSANGAVVAWGSDDNGQATVPAEAMEGVVAVAAGAIHSLALKADGTVVAWGSSSDQTNVPPGGRSGVASIAAGELHSLVLKQDGSLVGWGLNHRGQTDVLAGAERWIGVAGGAQFSAAWTLPRLEVGWRLRWAAATYGDPWRPDSFVDDYRLAGLLPAAEYAACVRDRSGGSRPRIELRDAGTQSVLGAAETSETNSAGLVVFTADEGRAYDVAVSSAEPGRSALYELAVYPVVRPGTAISGNLEPTDPATTTRVAAVGLGVWRYDDFLVRGAVAGDRLEVRLEAVGFAPFIEVRLLADEAVQDYADGPTYSLAVQGSGAVPRDYLIRVTTSLSGATGSYTLHVERRGAAPEIWSFSPESGVPGTRVRVQGANFLEGQNPVVTGVKFGGALADWTEPVNLDAGKGQEFEATVPPGAVSGPVQVLSAGGEGVSATPFVVLSPVGDVQRGAAGEFSFAVSNGVGGFLNVVERTVTLSPPMVWTPVATNVAGAGVWRHTNATQSAESQEFFRVRRQ